MPLVRIEARAGRWSSRKKVLLDAVHAALVEALQTPDDDRTQRLYELAPEDFEISPRRPDEFVLVEITMFPGRSRDAKRRLYQAIARNLNALGVAGHDILVVLQEPAMENWGTRGGIPADEVDLGSRVDVQCGTHVSISGWK